MMKENPEKKELNLVVEDLDLQRSRAELANDASYSTAQFARIAKKQLGEPPMSVRRRLLIERAAFELANSRQSVTEIAFDAGFQSLEGFGRSFRKAFGVSPSQFRTLRPTEFRADLSERLHYQPPVNPSHQGAHQMNVIELMTELHCAEIVRFVKACEKLPDSDLDTVLSEYEPEPWRDESVTLREMLGRAAAFAAPWMDAINGHKVDYEPKTLPDMELSISLNRTGFLALLKSVQQDNSYELTFVDSGCEPPMVFSYGGVLAHAITNATYRRLSILGALRRLNVGVDRLTDPIDFHSSSPKP